LLMPTPDRFAVVRALAEKKECAAIPILVVTGKDLSEQERAMLGDRIAGVVSKSRLTPEYWHEQLRALKCIESPS